MRKEEITEILWKYKNYALTDKLIQSITNEIFDLVVDDITQAIFKDDSYGEVR